MTGEQFETAVQEIDGGASIGFTLLYQSGDLGKSLIEQRRAWMVLRKTDTSKSVTTGNTWQTVIDLSTITDFNRFYGKYPIKLFDGNNCVERYGLIPFEHRLEYRDAPNTAVYDAGTKILYMNGSVNYEGIGLVILCHYA